MSPVKNENKIQEVRISHVFDAPRELVFEAWTDPRQLLQWYAPDGCDIEYKHIEVKQGGTFHSCIKDPVHGDCWCKGKYLEVNFPDKLVFTIVLTNENAEDISALQAGKATLPVATTVTVLFEQEGDKTKLMLLQTMQESVAKDSGAYQGWIRMLNRLQPLLDRSKNNRNTSKN